MDKVTFVIPAYNVSAYLADTIEAVISQTEPGWKMIIVDDCSSDRTAEIAESYATRDNRIRVIRLDRQSGSAYIPRKRGILEADTEFIAPLDADDSIEPDYLQSLLAEAERTRAEIVYPIMYHWNGDESSALPFDHSLTGSILEGREVVACTLDGWRLHCNGGLISRGLYLRSLDMVDEDDGEVDSYLDEYLTRVLLYNAGRTTVANVRYLYRDNTESITHRKGIDSFGAIANNLRLICFLGKRYEKGSEVMIRLHRQNFHGVFEGLRLLNSQPLSGEERNYAATLVKKCAADINYSLLKGRVSRKYYLLSRLMACLPFCMWPRLMKLADRMAHGLAICVYSFSDVVRIRLWRRR